MSDQVLNKYHVAVGRNKRVRRLSVPVPAMKSKMSKNLNDKSPKKPRKSRDGKLSKKTPENRNDRQKKNPKKFKCVGCMSPLRDMTRLYARKPESKFHCPVCHTKQIYGSSSDDVFTFALDSDSESDNETIELRDAELPLRAGHFVEVKEKKCKNGNLTRYGWLAEDPVQRRTGTGRPKYKVIFDHTCLEEVSNFTQSATREVQVQHAVGLSLRETLKKEAVNTIRRTISKLTNAEKQRFINITRGTHPNKDVLVKDFHTHVTYKIMRCLTPRMWLNDEVIHFYLNILIRSVHSDTNRICLFPSWFFMALARLRKRKLNELSVSTRKLPAVSRKSQYVFDYDSVKRYGPYLLLPCSYLLLPCSHRWTNKLPYPLWRYDRILVPIHDPGHWKLLNISPRQRDVNRTFDLGLFNPYNRTDPGLEVFKAIPYYLKHEINDKTKKYGLDKPRSQLHFDKTVPACPTQRNDYDCGVFLCSIAYCLSQGLPPTTFQTKHMPLFRHHIGLSIAQNSLHDLITIPQVPFATEKVSV